MIENEEIKIYPEKSSEIEINPKQNEEIKINDSTNGIKIYHKLTKKK